MEGVTSPPSQPVVGEHDLTPCLCVHDRTSSLRACHDTSPGLSAASRRKA